jgi:plastocyanin
MEPQVARAAAVVGTNTMTPAHPAIAALTHRADRAPDELPPGIHLPGPSGWPFLAPIALMFIFFGLVLGPALLIGGIVMGVIAAVGWLRDAGQEYHQTDAGGSVEPPSRDPQRALPFSLLKLYMGIAALSIVAIVGPSVITGVITRPAAGAPSGTAAPSGVPGNELSISARLIAFDTDRLLAPADQPFTILFDNQEAAPHNVTIFQGADPNAPVVLREDPFSGPQQVVYDVGPLAAGSYYFHCDVHPNMKGTLDAR